ncbi:hypothetical protein FHS36_005337 [Streptomyces eurocidicus]|uniref:Thiamine pyrophosphate enzyme N-terminal TPP-binding domain-containing protein n=1 Tax=Streptomyces eurocidicus TaxID=66423 RepID=A0A7W8BFH7_STREU|nr:hypothetical protein [Streptomyces eurocidicus]
MPVVAITGMPATGAAASGKLLHHTLGDGDYRHFSRMYAEVTVAHTTLGTGNAASEIDRVPGELLRHKRPVHINLPTDVVTAPRPQPSGPLAATGNPGTDPARLDAFSRTARACSHPPVRPRCWPATTSTATTCATPSRASSWRAAAGCKRRPSPSARAPSTRLPRPSPASTPQPSAARAPAGRWRTPTA